jgi:phage repressor protein C with HTH and peptisase S24 domain
MGNSIIKALREERGWTLRELAKRMDSYPQQISKYELGQTALTLDWIKKFASVFEVPASLIMGEDAVKMRRFPDTSTRKLAASEHSYASLVPGYELPVYGRAAAEGRIENIDGQTAPLDLGGLRNCFAVVVAGNSMEPRYRHGDYALVARGEWPQPLQDCLVETSDGAGFIKIYISHNDKKLACEQLNPRQKWEMPMANVKSVQLVKGRWK